MPKQLRKVLYFASPFEDKWASFTIGGQLRRSE